MRILYGLSEGHHIDVTQKAIINFLIKGILKIPSGDVNRAKYLGDPIPGTLKEIIVVDDNDTKTVVKSKDTLSFPYPHWRELVKNLDAPEAKLSVLHQNLAFKGGHIRMEYPEQLMSAMFIPTDAKVLEIGSNIGRNTLTIASLLNDETNLVTLECDPKSVHVLLVNRNRNGMKFHVEPSALSARRLVQHGWTTIPSEVDIPGYNVVPTITLEQLKLKYRKDFDTLVLDCEGAFYYILKDFPNILDGIKLILVENDYNTLEKKQEVDEILLTNGFTNVYRRDLTCRMPCSKCFFEAWKK